MIRVKNNENDIPQNHLFEEITLLIGRNLSIMLLIFFYKISGTEIYDNLNKNKISP